MIVSTPAHDALLGRFLKTGTLPTGARLIQLDRMFCCFETDARKDVVRRDLGKWVDVNASHKQYLRNKHQHVTI